MSRGRWNQWGRNLLWFLLLVIAILAFLGGLISLFVYDEKLAENTYVSENALLITKHVTHFNEKGRDDSQKTLNICFKYSDYINPNNSAANEHLSQTSSREIAEWLVTWLRLQRLGRPYIQEFQHGERMGHNVHTIIESPRSDGTEALVLFTTIHPSGSDLPGRINSVGILLGISRFLDRAAPWLSKDVIILFLDDPKDTYTPVQAWLSAYFGTSAHQDAAFPRAGLLAAALELDIDYNPDTQLLTGFDLLPEGVGGLLPNLDFVSLVNKATGHETVRSGLRSAESVVLGLDWLQRVVVKPYINPFLREYFGVRKNRVDVTLPRNQRVITMMQNVASGRPVASHGFFLAENVDAVAIVGRTETTRKGRISGGRTSIGKTSKAIESIVHSMSNLLEKLHQSFYYYLLAGLERYISIGRYMVTTALLSGALALRVLLLLGADFFSDSVVWNRQKHWVMATARAVVAEICGAVVFCAGLYGGEWIGFEGWMAVVGVVVVGFVGVCLTVLGGSNVQVDAALGLSVMTGFSVCYSLVNFPFAVWSTIAFAPVFVIVMPIANRFWLNLLQLLVLIRAGPLGVAVMLRYWGSVDVFAYARYFDLFGAMLYPYFCFIAFPATLLYLQAFLQGMKTAKYSHGKDSKKKLQ